MKILEFLDNSIEITVWFLAKRNKSMDAERKAVQCLTHPSLREVKWIEFEKIAVNYTRGA